MAEITLYPNAKVNLGLLIKGKRADGYHLLETLLYPIPDLKDTLSISENNTGDCSLEVSGINLDGSWEDNLCVKAYRLLKQAVPDLPGVNVFLKKNIPAGAGLGGGSSDAAFTLKGLNQLFDLGLTDDILAGIAGKLGADVPFFIYNKPLLARGIGTEFEEIDLEIPYRFMIVNSGIHSSTVAAYRALDYTIFDPNRDLKSILNLPVSQWSDKLDNDLEVPVFEMYPVLAETKAELYRQGAVYAAMSGSGSAVFGLFNK